MRALLLLASIPFLVSCAHAASKSRLKHVQAARTEARVPGARQAQAYAAAVHEAYQEGDYRAKSLQGVAESNDVIATIDRALPTASIDAPTLVAWRGMMFLDSGRPNEAFAEFDRSFVMGPNELAGKVLIEANARNNRPDLVGSLCAKTVPVVRGDDEKLKLIALCRKSMNALSPEGEMAWMSPELVAWYQDANARHIHAEIAENNARAERQQKERRVVRGMEQCSASCKEQGLYCQNDCHHDRACENRCVDINHACLDRCESRADDRLDR